ncbi:hypothetical protein JAO76_04765 [Pontibacter sp. BT310]|uniref:Uncharacterized protein n=1 Tax=Pontibacter populi TaxID=890055 RepID=A0ABS6X8P0_9BACT|nr:MULTISPECIES: hypothetical protein [Pontibacter]MBJ6117489.1 hypothetical protein [Pontibacter sp. BT310]MBR0569914.1 hypothetical protein [Microvirga sp. STS03]MBW3364342.1 hypothetical protein [Pontibacter populi]
MEIEKLNSFEKSRINLEIKQALLSSLALGVIAIIVASSLTIFFLRSDNLHLEKGLAITFVVFVAATGLLSYFYLSIKDYLADLRSGSKNTYVGQITGKSVNTNWGWHGNTAADAISQPKLDEYFIVVGPQKIFISKEDFDRLNIGDIVKASTSIKSNIFLGVIKE